MKTRTLILSGMNGTVPSTAILGLTGENTLFCNLRTYNIKAKDLYCVVVVVGEKHYVAHNIDPEMQFDFVMKDAHIDDNIRVALFDEDKKECKLSNNLNTDDIVSLRSLLDLPAQAPKDSLSEDENLNAEVHSTATESEKTVNFDTKNDKTEKNDKKAEENEEDFAETQNQSFFDSIAFQLDEMFKENSKCPEVEALIPNSSWVNVDFDNEEENAHYILGKIFDEDKKLKYICYGVPAQNSADKNANIDLDYAQWLPLEPEKENSAGFYIMYQDAETGDTVKFEK